MIKASVWNIELRVKVSYAFNIVPWGVHMNTVVFSYQRISWEVIWTPLRSNWTPFTRSNWTPWGRDTYNNVWYCLRWGPDILPLPSLDQRMSLAHSAVGLRRLWLCCDIFQTLIIRLIYISQSVCYTYIGYVDPEGVETPTPSIPRIAKVVISFLPIVTSGRSVQN